MPGESTQTFVPQGYLSIFASGLGARGPGGAFSSRAAVGTDLGKPVWKLKGPVNCWTILLLQLDALSHRTVCLVLFYLWEALEPSHLAGHAQSLGGRGIRRCFSCLSSPKASYQSPLSFFQNEPAFQC